MRLTTCALYSIFSPHMWSISRLLRRYWHVWIVGSTYRWCVCSILICRWFVWIGLVVSGRSSFLREFYCWWVLVLVFVLGGGLLWNLSVDSSQGLFASRPCYSLIGQLMIIPFWFSTGFLASCSKRCALLLINYLPDLAFPVSIFLKLCQNLHSWFD